MRRSLLSSALTASLALALAPVVLLAPAPAALADGEVPVSGPQEKPADTSRNTGSSGSCSLYGSANGFGMVCNQASGDGPTIKELLNGGKFPDCWVVPPPAGFVPPQETLPGHTWWQRICLSGIDRDTYQRTGPIKQSFEFVQLTDGQDQQLTDNETIAVQRFTGRGQIPFPIIATTPTASPRLGQQISFSVLRSLQRTPVITRAGVSMYAQLVQLKVQAGEVEDAKPIICDGPGLALTADQLRDLPDDQRDEACLYTYKRSSAVAAKAARRDRYPVGVTALWEIRYYPAGDPDNETVLGRYNKSAINLLRVTEVQTLVTS